MLYCAAAIAVSAVLNVVLALRYPPSHRLTNREATFYLAFDVLQLAALLYLTGGIANPFALMFVAPVVIAAATLNLGNTLILAGIAFASVVADRASCTGRCPGRRARHWCCRSFIRPASGRRW